MILEQMVLNTQTGGKQLVFRQYEKFGGGQFVAELKASNLKRAANKLEETLSEWYNRFQKDYFDTNTRIEPFMTKMVIIVGRTGIEISTNLTISQTTKKNIQVICTVPKSMHKLIDLACKGQAVACRIYTDNGRVILRPDPRIFVKHANMISQQNIIKTNIANSHKTIIHQTGRLPSVSLRYKVLSRDNHKCIGCGATPATMAGVELEIDHIMPYSKGGETVLDNLQTLCKKCNSGKGASL